MSKLTKKQLQQDIENLNFALSDLIIELTANDVIAGNNSELKQPTQSVFDGQDENRRFFAIDKNGEGWFYRNRPALNTDNRWMDSSHTPFCVGFDFDPTDWQDSLIERESELTGSDLARAMKNRNEWVLAYVSDANDATAEFHKRATVVTGATDDGRFKCGDLTWRFAVPIDNNGKVLTAKQAGF